MSISINKILVSAGVLAVTMQATTAIARDQIQVLGSSTVYPFSTIVAERFGNRGKFKIPVEVLA
jgi:phosphate transport system substrate-binding protein